MPLPETRGLSPAIVDKRSHGAIAGFAVLLAFLDVVAKFPSFDGVHAKFFGNRFDLTNVTLTNHAWLHERECAAVSISPSFYRKARAKSESDSNSWVQKPQCHGLLAVLASDEA